MKVALILPAAGVGKRFGAAEGGRASKVEVDLDGRAVFLRAIEAFKGVQQVGQIILAVNPESLASFKFKWGDACALAGVTIVAGGTRERWETVLKALGHVAEDVTHVAIHDAARPLVSRALIERVLETAGRFDAVVPGMAVSHTLKRVVEMEEDQDRSVDPLAGILGEASRPRVQVQRVVETVDRAGVVEIQTPQVFALSLLRRAYSRIEAQGGTGATDDAMLVEALGEPVRVVEGELTNLKITRPADLELAAAIVAHRKPREAAATAKKRLFGDDDE